MRNLNCMRPGNNFRKNFGRIQLQFDEVSLDNMFYTVYSKIMRSLLAFFYVSILLFSVSCANQTKQSENDNTLKEALKDKFYIGTALNLPQIRGTDTLSLSIVKKQFSSIVAENYMKSMYLQPKEGEFFFEDADKFVEFGEENNLFIIGHTLIWHSQAPDWFFVDENGNDVSPDVLKERMKNHIHTVVGRYKGRIHGWDVVNEAILDNGEWRKSKFYEILSEEFIPLAFQYAHEADPDAELYYNDYNEWIVPKQEAIVDMVNKLKSEGLRIDGVGMQGHMVMDRPTIDEYRKAIEKYSSAGVKVLVTEFDLSALPYPRREISSNISDTARFRAEMNPYPDVLPDSITVQWNKRMVDLFRLFVEQSDKISRVTMWGVTDADSWKNNFPMPGRTDYPLLFDRNGNPKPVVEEIIRMAANKNTDSSVLK